jgi:hypothetical protein
MKALRYMVAGLCAAALCVGGCACPRRRADTSHRIEYFQGREDGLVVREEWRDSESGGGVFIFADPNVQAMTALHTNQSALGGGSLFTAGSMVSVVDSNVTPVIGATGTAIGNVVKAAVK